MADKKPTVTITKLTDWISVKEFEGDKGNTVRYFAQPNNRAASTSSVLRYAAENNVTVAGLLDMLRVSKKTKAKATKVGKAQGKVFDHESFVDKLETYEPEQQIIILSRVGDEEIRAIDLALRGKKVTNRGPKVSKRQHMNQIFESLDIPYHMNKDGEIEDAEDEESSYMVDDLVSYFEGI